MERKGRAMLTFAALWAVTLAFSSSGAAQSPASMHSELLSTLAAAEAGANRPGDASLSCEALEGELVTTAKHPALQAFIAKSGAAAQEKVAAMNVPPATLATQAALTLFSSIVPGGAWAGIGAGATAQAQQAQAARNVQQHMQQAQEMMAIMPQLMRGQRVIELAQVRDCGWLREGVSR
jgi:hypothetical protein